ncbi:MAG: tRNA (guanosine(37)-N1)-methyltransferase TrmD [Patescibacteria group bacterium]
MQIALFTLFPHFFDSFFEQSLWAKAVDKKLISFSVIDIRQYATDKHQVTDDRPFGGGPGMIMKVEPIDRAVSQWKEQLLSNNTATRIQTVLTSATGVDCTQERVRSLAQLDAVGIVCGHYGGVDERVLELGIVDQEIRVGSAVLSGGEPAAIYITDAVSRLVPGFMGNQQSIIGESHDEPGLGGYPQYTRPEVYKTKSVPEVLKSGNHAEIKAWKEQHRKKLG